MNTAKLEQQAIDSASQGVWNKAIKLNQEILRVEPENIAALNRLAKAFLESGQHSKSIKTYKKVLSIDRYNPIAEKNIQRLEKSKSTTAKEKSGNNPLILGLFLEEPGKTKVVKLLRLTSPEILAEMDCGDNVCLVPQKRFIIVKNGNGEYIGRLPDDISYRLTCLIKGGNRYQANILGVERQSLEIFIREIFRSQKLRNLSSF